MSKLFAWLSYIFRKPQKVNVEQAIELPIPNCESLAIKLTWMINISKSEIERAFIAGVNQVELHPFITQSGYEVWLLKVLELGGVAFHNDDCHINILNKRSNTKPVSSVIPKLVNCISVHEKQEDIRQSPELLVLLGQLRRAVSEVKFENLLDDEKQLYNRLLVGFDNEIDRLPQWLVQFKAIKKKSWGER